MPVTITTENRIEAKNLAAALLAYGTGVENAGDVMRYVGEGDAYNHNIRRLARRQGLKLAVALGFGDHAREFLRHYDRNTRQWDHATTQPLEGEEE